MLRRGSRVGNHRAAQPGRPSALARLSKKHNHPQRIGSRIPLCGSAPVKNSVFNIEIRVGVLCRQEKCLGALHRPKMTHPAEQINLNPAVEGAILNERAYF